VEIYLNPLVLPILNSDKRFNVLYGGRSSGKSYAMADILLIKSFTEKDILILCLKGTMKSISDSVKQLLEDSIDRHNLREYYTITDKEIVCNVSGSRFIFYGLTHPDRLKSLEGVSYCWIEEAAVDVSEKALDILFPTIRKVGSKIFITFNPRFKKDAVYKRFIIDGVENSNVIKMNYYDNPHNSEEILNYIAEVKSKNLGKYLHEFEGELVQAIEGSLWKSDYFNHVPSDVFDMKVVSMDPSGSDSKDADEAGLIVAGSLGDKAWIIADESGRITQLQQAKRAIRLYNEHECDYIIVEKNGVGTGMKTIIRQIDKNIPIKEINATKSKKQRAIPVASLYEDGRIFHNKIFTEMEYEMVTFDENNKKISPGRLDAAVHAVTFMLLKKRVNIPGQSTTNNKNKSINQKTNKSISPFKFQI